ncbi:MAG: winged helix-turn-helix domain-containing protein [Halieaceae bacterium]|nr:winged helix-turn-helix domain-containing protein [Halieaceae bacterium]
MSRRQTIPGTVSALLIYVIGCAALLWLAAGTASAGVHKLLLLSMLALAPVLVAVVGYREHRDSTTGSDGAGEGDGAVYSVGSARVDTATRQISFAGSLADVQPKVFDLIVYLMRCRERVVSKDELFDAIWPSVVVSEASLTQSIKRARDLFRQHGFDEDVIRTVSRKGYQFSHEVTVAGPGAAVQAPAQLSVKRETALIALLALAVGAWLFQGERPVTEAPPATYDSASLAVLPFANLSGDPDFAYFSDGLTETITNSLTRVRGLRVIATGSAFSYRETETGIATIGQQLRVGHLVQGGVQRVDDQLRISARLIRVADGAQLWSQIFSREFDDVFTLHDDIARATVQQLSSVLAGSLSLPAAAAPALVSSDDSEAYRLLLRGQALRKRGVGQDIDRAVEVLRRALELRPDYAEAMVALADAIRLQAVTGELPRESAFSEALILSRKALGIDPSLAEAWVQIGEIQHRHFWNFDDAADSYRKAMEINPGGASAHSAYSRFLAKAGRDGEAVREAEIALDLNPLSTNAAASLALRLMRAGDLPAARTALDDYKRRHPASVELPWLETNWHILNGSNSDALEWSALEELDYLRLSLSAIALQRLGRTGQAELALQELIDTDAEGAAFQIAEVYAQWKEVDEAFAWLNRAYEQGDPGLTELFSSLNLANLYADPRFAEMAKNVGLPAPPEQF